MARGSKTTDAQSKKSTNAASEGRVALKDVPAKGKNRRKEAEPEVEEVCVSPRIFDERTKRDITGVAIAVLAVVLFVTAVLPPSGFITSALATGLHLALGIGSYVLPFVLIIVGVSFLARSDADSFALRMGVGLAMLFFAFETILSLFTPGADTDSGLLFVQESLVSRGGYLGAGVSWALLELLGRLVGCIVMVGVACGGAVVIGFSISGALRLVQEKASDIRERRVRRKEEREDAAGTALDAPAYVPAPEPAPARIRRADVIPRVPRDLSRPRPAVQSLNTQILGGSHIAQGGPRATSVDMYWPSDYAYDEARAIVDENSAMETAKTRVVGVEDVVEGSFVSDVAREVDESSADEQFAQIVPSSAVAKPERKKRVKHRLPWEDDDADMHTADASVLLEDVQASPAKPITRKLERSHVAAQEPADDSSSKKTKVLKKRPASSTGANLGETRGGFMLPAFSLIRHTEHAAEADERELASTAGELQGTLEDFNIMASVVGWVAGPTVTLFKVDLPSGVRVSRIMALQDDIALALAAPGVRIFAPIPGTNHVGIEVPNKKRQNVLLGDVIKDAKGSPLEMAIGKDVEGHSIVTDLAKMPHLLIGGTTGSGKSVAINAMIMSILMRATPDEVRFIMIDPKRVEFTPYNGIPHLYVPVVTENKEAASALAWGVAEMERRLKVLSKVGVRNISQYNAKVESGVLDDCDDEDAEPTKKMPYIVIIIDELADLMMNVGKEVELSISRIAQLARAAGIHLIVATQRPSTNVVTGLIKANITNRIAFNVASGIDSRVILDTPGAENLIGLGDMLFSKPEYAKPQRLQGCFVSEDEIEAVVEHLKAQGEPDYHQEILQTNVIGLGASMPDGSGGSSTSDDPLLWEAADIVVSSGMGSTSNIQRRLSVGYSRAGRIMDMLEEKGIVGPPNGSKPREVLVDAMELETLKAFEAQDAAESGF